MKNTKKELSTNANDIVASLLKSFVSIIPWVGGALSEIVSYTIPNQRQDRIVNFIKEMNCVIQKISSDVDSLKQRLDDIQSDKGQCHILELAFQEAVETDSTILHHCYAYYVFHNLENKTLNDIQREKIIKTISELNEYEIIHLLNFLFPSFIGNVSDFFERYKAVLMQRPNYIGSPEEDVEFNAFFNQYRTTLEQKGLIVGVPNVKDGTIKFDDKKYSITPFGEIVANAIYDDDFFGKNKNSLANEF